LIAPITLLLFATGFNQTIQFLILVICAPIATIYVLWDIFSTPFYLAKGTEISRKPFWAAALCFFSPSLGFLYLKRWEYAFTFLFWALFVTTIAAVVNNMNYVGPKIFEGWPFAANIAEQIFETILPLGIKAYVIIDSARTAFQLAKEKKDVA
jgi:hypothetical protein